MNIPDFNEIVGQNDQTEARREHLEKLRAIIGNVYPNKFERSRVSGKEDTISNILHFEPIVEIVDEINAHISTLNEGERPAPELKESLNAKLKEFGTVRVSGRMAVPPRVMGKAAFVHLSDGIERLQIYVRKQDASVVNNDTGKMIETEEAAWEVFKLLDHGDFIGASGFLFLTNTGELSVHVETFQFLAKAMLPMPDKMHGIHDAEIRQRQRYADLIGSSLQVEHEGLTTREVFERRAKFISSIRNFLEEHGYIEVETPMLTPKATGAAAKPFKTHHNALDIDLYARIAPELYLKRLTVGGFEKVYELNRNFRNEGISYKHNPEFTMLEFYCAYMDVNGMMDFCEELLKISVRRATGGLKVNYEEKEIDFSKFRRVAMKEAIIDYANKCPAICPGGFNSDWLNDKSKTVALARYSQILTAEKNIVILEGINQVFDWSKENHREEIIRLKALGHNEAYTTQFSGSEHDKLWEILSEQAQANEYTDEEYGNAVATIFENWVESTLINPTFIIDYPKSISPLSKASPEDPNIAERFELFINGMECANGFSELNDPKEQYERFVDQMSERERGDEEAMIMDEDYIRALSYGMPPAAGIGIGIDRLVMLLTNKHSIRDVILFPHLRPEKKRDEENDN